MHGWAGKGNKPRAGGKRVGRGSSGLGKKVVPSWDLSFSPFLFPFLFFSKTFSKQFCVLLIPKQNIHPKINHGQHECTMKFTILMMKFNSNKIYLFTIFKCSKKYLNKSN